MVRRLVLAVVLFCAACLPAAAEEYIRSYHSEIAVAPDGELTVTETIVAKSEGNRIRRGIFRDFPLTMVDAAGRTVRVGFDIVSVTRDGRDEPYRAETIAGGIRIYSGDQDVFLRDGEHTFVLTYRTDRQIRYFDDHDELYWNVTGNGWDFRITQASARVTLPDGGQVQQTTAFTGPLGSTARNARMQANGDNAVFSTTRPLGPQEGLTIVAGFPKGVVAVPSKDQERSWWLRDHMGTLIAGAGLLIVLAYYFAVWKRVGRDPARGIVVPRWDAPEGLSPALVNYIDNKGFSGGGWTAFAASAIDLAVKGYVVLDDLSRQIVIRRTDKSSGRDLPAGQSVILSAVGGKGESFVIDKNNGTAVKNVGKNFRQAIEREHRGKYYNANWGYVLGGIGLSVIFLIALLVFGNLEPDMIAVLIVPVFVAVFFGFIAVGFGKKLRRGSSLFGRIMTVVVLGFIGLVALSIVTSVLVALVSELTGTDHWPLLVSVGGIVLANVMFFFLMGAPTPIGAKLMDGIEGLRLYLTVAEKDRMNMAGAPEMSPQHFEKLLPYAVALGVEKPWSQAFDTWLAAAGLGAAYTAAWYHGGGFNSFGDRIGGFSSSMASTIASTLPQPTSSSSSGFSTGGSSGGGGGGGGGGGW
ncbi:DUF2207 domain-containing protein [Rhizobium sp. CFBP 13726]|uniref:DUF2207 domain-containing protein n=1 Tax=Rhizobium sp. CFBP 13726 TaxID=2775296 RepID=UPI00178221D6|nr:DUF2207 domain-containing protein [Rhizobium sp. CFBP 13726]MBD8649566.1 DUF2207 domain-containing protein [Rhizobium sp. CFBP 13726]